jgi:hypothetical protein
MIAPVAKKFLSRCKSIVQTIFSRNFSVREWCQLEWAIDPNNEWLLDGDPDFIANNWTIYLE